MHLDVMNGLFYILQDIVNMEIVMAEELLTAVLSFCTVNSTRISCLGSLQRRNAWNLYKNKVFKVSPRTKYWECQQLLCSVPGIPRFCYCSCGLLGYQGLLSARPDPFFVDKDNAHSLSRR